MAASRTDKAQAFHLAVIPLHIGVIDLDVDAHRESSVKQRSVTRIGHSEIRSANENGNAVPDVASLHPGYKLLEGQSGRQLARPISTIRMTSIKLEIVKRWRLCIACKPPSVLQQFDC